MHGKCIQNTNDLKSDEVENEKPNIENLLTDLEQAEEGECESCTVQDFFSRGQ